MGASVRGDRRSIALTFDFDEPIDRGGTGAIKWDRYAGRDIIPMWVADMDFLSPPAVIAALRERAAHGVFGYTFPTAELTQAVMELLAREWRWKIEPDWIVWLPGLVSGINVTCRAVGAPGDAVLTNVPIYPPFLTAPGHMERDVIQVPLTRTGERWEIDCALLEAAITPRTRLMLLCSPHNPCGRVWTREELLTIAEICLRHEVIICSDEIHNQLVLEPGCRHIPTATLSREIAEQTITLMAPSKTYNIAGLGCSLAIIPNAKLRADFQAAQAGIVPHINALGYTAALAAFREGEPWRRALLAYLRGNRDLVTTTIAEIEGLATTPIEATYLAWIDARATGLEDPARFFEEAGVGLSDGKDFAGDGYLRLNFGCPRALLTRALERMQAALARRGET